MKKLLIATGIGVVALSLFGFKKAIDYSTVLDQLKVKPEGIAQPTFTWQHIGLKLRLLFTNPTATSLDVTTLGFITLKELYIFDTTGKQLATVAINKSDIAIPANGSYRTDWLDVQLPLSTALNNLVTGFDANVSQFTYKAKLTITGYGEYIVG